MAGNLNKALLIGNLTRDPEVKYIPSGQAVATFTLAMNRTYLTQNKEKKEYVSFVKVVVWGKIAEICGQYLSKGRSVFVEGRLQSRSWETQDGQKRSTLEVVAQTVQFLDKASRQNEPAAKPAGETVQVSGDEEIAPSALSGDDEAPF